MIIRRGICILILALAVCTGTLFAQETDWYYDKPIRSVAFDGLENVKSADLSGITAPYIGKNFDDFLYEELLNKIYALDYFESINPRVFPYDQKNDAVVLRFEVVELPVISSITYTGNRKLRTPELKDTVNIKVKDIFNENRMRLDERAIRDLYLKRGYTNIRVSSETAVEPDGIGVKFIIDEGASTVVKSIQFEGNEVVTDKTLKGVMKLKEVSLFNKGAFQESTLEMDKQALLSYYQTRGYVDVEIRDIIRTMNLNTEKNENELTLTVVIREGIQYTYGGTVITGNEIFTTEKLLSNIKLKEGAVFNQIRFMEGLAALADVYFENGYTSNYIGPEQEKDVENKKISYTVLIVERPRSHIERIILKGNKKTKDSVILRELPLEGGDIFSKTKLISGLRNLYNLQYFSAVVPDIVPGSEENLVDLVISVEEQSTTSVEFGITFSGLADPETFPLSLFVKWQDSNLLGTGKSVSTNLAVSPDTQSLQLGYADNWLFGQPIGVGMNLEVLHARHTTLQTIFSPSGLNISDYYMDYEQWKFAWNGLLGRRWYPKFAILNLNGGLQIGVSQNFYDKNIVTPYDSTLSNYHGKWVLGNTVWTGFSMDNRDINYDPSKGWFFSERVSWTGLIPKIEADYYFKSDTKLEGYVTLLDLPVVKNWNLKFVLAGYTGLSFLIPAPGKIIGYDSQLYIDGMFTGRGWQTLYNNPSARGQALWSSYLEFRMPIIPNIFALDIFFDAVAVKPTVKDMFTNLKGSDFYFSFGPGIRFSLPQFPLRLMLANTFKIVNGQVRWGNDGNATGPDWKFVLSFNVLNR